MLKNITEFNPDTFFKKLYTLANKEYIDKSQAHKAPVDWQAVSYHLYNTIHFRGKGAQLLASGAADV